MKKNNKGIVSSVEFVVFNCFIRTIKSDGKYMLFRRSVNNTGIMKYLLKNQPKPYDNPFASASSIEDVVRTLNKITNDMARSSGKKNGVNDLDKYEHVTMTINHLLHFFMESNGITMDKLCSLGESIYALSCNKLFGDTVEDIEKQEEEEMKNLKGEELDKAKLIQEFVNGLKNGTISANITFDEFISKKQKAADDLLAFTMNNGHVLGRLPDEYQEHTATNAYVDNNDWQF